jgi:hypothetical protein
MEQRLNEFCEQFHIDPTIIERIALTGELN